MMADAFQLGSQRPPIIMNCQQLAERLALLQPDSPPADIARLCLLILNSGVDASTLEDQSKLATALRIVNFRLESAADQHAAMAAELDTLCQDGPVRFSPDQIWALLRAVKVQSQLLDLYTDQPMLV